MQRIVTREAELASRASFVLPPDPAATVPAEAAIATSALRTIAPHENGGNCTIAAAGSNAFTLHSSKVTKRNGNRLPPVHLSPIRLSSKWLSHSALPPRRSVPHPRPFVFSVKDLPVPQDFMEQYSLATLVTRHSDELIASHPPFVLDRDAGPHGRKTNQETHAACPNSTYFSPKDLQCDGDIQRLSDSVAGSPPDFARAAPCLRPVARRTVRRRTVEQPADSTDNCVCIRARNPLKARRLRSA